MKNDDSRDREEVAGPNSHPGNSPENATSRTRKVGPTAVAFVIGLAALTAQASESDVVRDIQRYCTVCWRNARLDPRLWDDCTQEVCCRLLTKARDGQLDLTQVLAEDTSERRELVRAIDMVRKRVQRTKRYQSLDDFSTPTSDLDRRSAIGMELGEILESARRAVLSNRGRIASSNSGCGAPRSPKSVPSSTCRSPGSATRSTRRCGNWSNTSRLGATSWNSDSPPRSVEKGPALCFD